MTSLYLCDDPIGQREYARRHGVAVTTINHQLTVALKNSKNAPKLKFASYKSKKFPSWLVEGKKRTDRSIDNETGNDDQIRLPEMEND